MTAAPWIVYAVTAWCVLVGRALAALDTSVGAYSLAAQWCTVAAGSLGGIEAMPWDDDHARDIVADLLAEVGTPHRCV